MTSRGFETIEKRDATSVGIEAQGSHRPGTWCVIMKRPLITGDPEQDFQFVEGAFIPVAFAAWDGGKRDRYVDNKEQNSQKRLLNKSAS